MVYPNLFKFVQFIAVVYESGLLKRQYVSTAFRSNIFLDWSISGLFRGFLKLRGLSLDRLLGPKQLEIPL